MYFILLLVLYILLFAAVTLYKGDYMCPAVVLPFTYLMCSLYGALLYNEWDASSMSYKTVLVVFVGILSFMLCSYLPWKTQKIRVIHIKKRYTRINVGAMYFLVSFIVCLLAITTQYSYLRNSLSSLGIATDSLSQMINTMRYIKIHTALIVSDPIIVKIFRELAIGLGIFSLYIFLRNFCLYKFKTSDILHLLIWSFQIIIGFFTGGRFLLIINVVMSFYITYFYWGSAFFKQKFVFRKVIRWIVITISLFIITFLSLNVILGRTASLSDMNIKQYLGCYIWGGTRNLDLFLIGKSGFAKQSGSETFKYLSTRLGLSEKHQSPSMDGSSFINGHNIGNIYSSFGRFYADLEMLGVLIFSGLQGLIFTSLYVKAQKNIKLNRESFVIIFFAYFSYTTFYFPIDEVFYSGLITFGITCRILFLYFLYFIYVRGFNKPQACRQKEI